jgi:hypothetical protein
MACVGAVDINVTCSHVLRTIYSENVAYIPSFHTNIVRLRGFSDKGVHWNTAASQLLYHSSPFCDVVTQHGQWVLEFNPVPPQMKEQPDFALTTCSSGPQHDAESATELWHRSLGHVNDEAFLKLYTAVTGICVLNCPWTSCQIYPVAKSTTLPSCHPSALALQPFARVHLDLQQFTRGDNSKHWVQHFLDDFSKMHCVYMSKA